MSQNKSPGMVFHYFYFSNQVYLQHRGQEIDVGIPPNNHYDLTKRYLDFFFVIVTSNIFWKVLIDKVSSGDRLRLNIIRVHTCVCVCDLLGFEESRPEVLFTTKKVYTKEVVVGDKKLCFVEKWTMSSTERTVHMIQILLGRTTEKNTQNVLLLTTLTLHIGVQSVNLFVVLVSLFVLRPVLRSLWRKTFSLPFFFSSYLFYISFYIPQSSLPPYIQLPSSFKRSLAP